MHRARRSRLAARLLVVTVGMTGLVAVAAAPSAMASGTSTLVAPNDRASYTDSAHPGRSYSALTTDIPLGASRDARGGLHVSRIYLSYDLSGVAHRHILGAKLSIQETEASGCADRQVQLWRTADASWSPTWSRPWPERSLLSSEGGTSACPAWYQFDLSAQIEAAAAAGASRFSVELRTAAAVEQDPAQGRRISWSSGGIPLAVTYNTVPTVPTQLYNGLLPCTPSQPYQYVSDRGSLSLGVLSADADSGDDLLTVEAAVWPVDQPDQALTYSWSGINGYYRETSLPGGTLTDGATYAWHARVSDGQDTSDWSKTCYLVIDSVSPAAPAVTSATFPENVASPGGTPAGFTFTGDTDVAAYQYSWNELSVPVGTTGPGGVPTYDPFSGPDFVRPAEPGGSASITLVPPFAGPNTLTVRSYDRAGNPSPTTQYRFSVKDTSPVVTATGTPEYGKPFTVHVAPGAGVSGVESYSYVLNYEAEQTIPARPDGTADITITFTQGGGNFLQVRSTSGNGWVSPQTSTSYFVDTSPVVTSVTYPASGEGGGVGVPGVFTFTPGRPGVESYTYYFDGGDTVSVDPAADGTASVTWTPDTAGPHSLIVLANYPDSTEFADYEFLVATGT